MFYFEDSYFIFGLAGVIVHSSTLEGGHYFSYIKERTKDDANYGKWFQFDDSNVRLFDADKIKDIAFGKTIEEWKVFGTCAYLLFYERIKSLPTEFDTEGANSDLLQKIKLQNKQKMLLGSFFNEPMFNLFCPAAALGKVDFKDHFSYNHKMLLNREKTDKYLKRESIVPTYEEEF